MPKEECLSCVQLLVRKGAQVNAKDDNGQTPLHLACARGNTRVVRQLLECHGLALEVKQVALPSARKTIFKVPFAIFLRFLLKSMYCACCQHLRSVKGAVL